MRRRGADPATITFGWPWRCATVACLDPPGAPIFISPAGSAMDGSNRRLRNVLRSLGAPMSPAAAADDEWLAQTTEDPLEPGLPIVDAHHHLWDKLQLWPGADDNITRRYLIEELVRDTGGCGHNVIKTVFVQCKSMHRASGPELFKPVGEVEFAQGIAAMSASGIYGDSCEHCAGIVSTVDLTAGAAVEPVLREQMKSRNFRGIRFRGGSAETIPFDDHTFREGVAVLDRLGLTLDCNGPETHPLDFEYVLGGLTRLAAAFPSLSIIVDHCGGAVGPAAFDRQPGKLRRWKELVRGLAAASSNVVMKIGGIQMSVNGFGLSQVDRGEGPPVGSKQLCELTLPCVRVHVHTPSPPSPPPHRFCVHVWEL
jgi:L-fuconolactonase